MIDTSTYVGLILCNQCCDGIIMSAEGYYDILKKKTCYPHLNTKKELLP